ncbi:MAG: acyl-CoA dehydrogenase [Rhizobiales bacterium NRL2]|nr:MAG: acyl-CoA dehydrogenase [Rhizobiales bacterium NRL2]
MNLDFSDDQKMLRDHVRRFLTDRCPSSAVRAVLESDLTHDAQVYTGLAELGVLGAAIPEEFGGAGQGPLELCVVAEELGRALAPVPVASSIYLAADFIMTAGSEAQKRHWLPKLAAGEAIGCFAHGEAPGRTTVRNIATTATDGRVSGVKAPVADAGAADFAIVSVRNADGLSLRLVELNAEGVRVDTVDSIDPARKQARITFENAPSEPLGDGADGARTVETVLDRAAVLLAFEQIGGADRALETATEYARERMAFGRQIGSFQAIKHMLADMYVSATLARSNAYYGAWAISNGAAETPVAAATARVSATQAYQHCAKNNIQVHGGMGFTWAFDCHLHYRRANGLALALGPLSAWEDRLIEQMRNANASAA